MGELASYKVGLVSYMPAMMAAIERTEGPILELGCGIGTFFLHWACLDKGRELHSYDDLLRWYNFVKRCKTDNHSVTLIENWDDVPMEQPWAVALVDHCMAVDRVPSIRRLADWAQAIVLHDTKGRHDKKYHYSTIWPLFKYTKHYPHVYPGAAIISNFRDVSKWR
jgi:hypothetical protein